jgi:beta-glucosidase-like glycosyl hydrolase
MFFTGAPITFALYSGTVSNDGCIFIGRSRYRRSSSSGGGGGGGGGNSVATSAAGVQQEEACRADVGSGLLHSCVTAAPSQRADDLMTLLSPVEIVQQTWAPDGGDIDALMQWIGDGTNGGGLGWFSFGSARSKNGNVTESVLQRNELQRRIMAASAHHIPAAVFNEALHGANAGGTVFPELATQGATWDVDLIEEIGAAIAREARGCGIDTALSPVLNMWVDSRFGRLQEGYSENPTLTTAYAIAQAKGLQGAQPKGEWAYFNRSKVVALAKHYAAYGAALGGLNGAPAELSERTLREWYLRPWRAFAAAGGKGAMASHNTVLNQPMHANDYVTNQIFRKEFGFGEGVIVSDCNDVPALVSFRTAANLSQAAARGIKGGIDLDLQCTLLTNRTAYTHLEQAVADGLLSLEKIKVAAKRVLAQKYALGLFEEPFVDPAQAAPGLDTPAHRALALRAAEEGIVLLKNDKDMLPLSTAETGRGNSVAVIGANGGCEEGMMLCDGRTNLLGSYTQYIHYPVSIPSTTAIIC